MYGMCMCGMCILARIDVYLCSQPAYNYSVENKMLTAALDKQQNRVHHIYSTIAGKKEGPRCKLLPAYMTTTNTRLND